MSNKCQNGTAAAPNGATGEPPAKKISASTSAALNKGEIFWTSLQNLSESMDQVLQESEGLQEYCDLISSHAMLEDELQRKEQAVERKTCEMDSLRTEKDKEIAEWKQKLERRESKEEFLLHTFESRHRSWLEQSSHHESESAELSQLRDKFRKLKGAAEEANRENKQLRSEVAAGKDQADNYLQRISALEHECKRKELEREEAQYKYNSNRRALEERDEELGFVAVDPDKMCERFGDLATNFHKLVQDCFSKEIPDPSIINKNLGTSLSQIPQVSSNSEAAKCIRCAFAEAVVAQELSKHIFQRFFFLEKEAAGAESRSLARALAYLNENHPQQATIIRCQLSRAYEDSQSAKVLPNRATEAVCAILDPWLSGDAERKQHFAAELTKLFSTALKLWQRLQRSRRKITVSDTIDINSNTWLAAEDSWPEYDNKDLLRGDGQRPQQMAISGLMSKSALAVLFPQIHAEQDGHNNDEELLFHGFALFSEQAAVVAVNLERSSTQRGLRRTSTTHRRRMSDYNGHDRQTADRQVMTGRRPSASTSGIDARPKTWVACRVSEFTAMGDNYEAKDRQTDRKRMASRRSNDASTDDDVVPRSLAAATVSDMSGGSSSQAMRGKDDHSTASVSLKRRQRSGSSAGR